MRIICFHQSADLYGSDRSFLQVVEYFVSSGKVTRLTVVLPRSGPLVDKLNALGVQVMFMELSLLSKTYLKKLQWGKILFPLFGLGKKKKLIEEYDLLYVNTSVILDFYVLAPLLKIKKVLHIREIPAKWLGKILSAFISKSNALVIFNSNSTKASFSPFAQSLVIHNAFEGYSYNPSSNLGFDTEADTPLNLLLIGRINGWKGQDFAIRALSKLPYANYKLRIVGSTAAGNETLVDELKALVKDLNLTDHIEFADFTSDPSQEYANTDVIIIPSTKPEPFGRIAIEAMSLAKPVIAANHGGLPEIIQHDRNGFLFEPNDENSFNRYLTTYLTQRELVHTHGIASRKIYEEKFSVEQMRSQLNDVFMK